MSHLNTAPDSRDWAPLFAAFADILEWLFDRAQLFAREYPDEVAAVERIRMFVRKRIAGDPAHARIDDLLFTIGLIAGALEQQRQAQRQQAARSNVTEIPGRLPRGTDRMPLKRAQPGARPAMRIRRPS